MVSASAFFLSSACPFVAPVRRAFITASIVTVGATTYLHRHATLYMIVWPRRNIQGAAPTDLG